VIEVVMYFALGLLVAGLGAIVIIPLIHGRAVRLTERRLEGAIPASMAEIVADKDLLRAEFAMATRKLEIEIDHLRAGNATARAELGRKSDLVNRLKIELGILRAEPKTAGENFVLGSSGCEPAPLLRDDNAEPATMPSLRSAAPETAKPDADEVATMRTQVLRLTDWLAQAGAEIRALNAEHSKLESAAKQVEEERHTISNFRQRASVLVRQLMIQANEDKIVRSHAQELEARLAEQSQLLNERKLGLARLQDELDVARDAEANLRVALVEIDGRVSTTITENGKLKESLDRANGERVRLTYELANIRRRVEAAA
jgi:DNA repair exonuclease SbcCD ATPase subunit